MSRTRKKHRTRPRSGSRSRGPQSAPTSSDLSARAPHPLFDWHLLGLTPRWVDRLATIVLIGVIIGCRIAAFPGSIWDQDEAYFAVAVVDFEPAENQPHPPWFPLFIGLAKIPHALGADPARSIQLVSALLGCWMIFPLISLWSGIIGRRLGVAAALLFMFLPGPWLLAGRGYSGTVATAFFAAGLAFWLSRPDNRWSPALGGVFVGLAVLTRPHLAPAALVALLLVVGWNSSPRWRAALMTFGATIGVGGIVLILATSGLEPLRNSLAEHSQYHFSRLQESSGAFTDSGLARCLVSPVVAWLWVILSCIGAWSVMRVRPTRRAAVVVVGALFGVLAIVVGASDPGHARYFVPVLALSTGFVVAALDLTRKPAVYGSIGVAMALSIWVVAPQLADYRAATSPAILALEEAATPTDSGASILVVDHSLISFVGLVKTTRERFPGVAYDNQIEAGQIPPPPPKYATAVFAEGHDVLVEHADERRVFRCSVDILRRLERDRYLDVVVARNPVLKGWVDDGRPYIVIDGD